MLPPVLPTACLGAMGWQLKPVQKNLLPPGALEKKKGGFNQGGMKGGFQTEDSLSGVAGCPVQIMFLTLPRG